MLLPEAFGRGPVPEAVLAFEEDSRTLVGAAAFRIEQQAAALAMIRVVSAHRRRGIGTALVKAVIGCVRERGCTEFAAMADAKAHPEAEVFLTANGFTRVSRLHVFEMPREPVREAVTKLLRRAERSRRLPESARIVPPSEAPTEEMVQIYDQMITRAHPEYLKATITDERFERFSSVLLVDGHVAAMLIVGYEPGEQHALVPARAVLDGFRGGLANIMLMAASLEKGRAAGIDRIRFESLDDNHDTLRLAQRFGAQTLHLRDRFNFGDRLLNP